MFLKTRTSRILLLAVAILACGFLFVCASIWLREPAPKSVRYGVTYSTVYAWHLGLDVMQSYKDLIEDLGVRIVRLPVYWPDVEPDQGKYVWNQLDELVRYSESRQVELTLVVGRKVPRWPECFIPSWAQKLSKNDQEQAVKDMIETVVRRYRSSPAIVRWQIENEPFLPFGVCEQISKNDLQTEIALVRSLDTRPIQVTASGEMNPWGMISTMGDVLGISVYRETWNAVFGYFTYPLSPLFYRVRSWPIRWSGKEILVSELQAEPWFSEDLNARPVTYWYEVFTAEDFVKNINFVNEIGVSEVDLWGAEWWMYAKQHGEPRLWNEAAKLFP
ncbi:hypothetical protein A2318_03365 [Candidatus Uhrbacteria bacterium RIFOXYB2_FULL_45_11]|uniref:Glycoside hydrolase family 5 domain-containing protein n=1 Tax=Candidatus Uhrbacteria bacterium RIFOXYB2_FULL_45_11 TaxID=1802421 RepID=A0A1F7W0W9_9BACT|nr:MAG: hypothetical protein A2318_03365 [Candidatus Uhrbacteria bacterium RIFOXYB2_FULL_45_11]